MSNSNFSNFSVSAVYSQNEVILANVVAEEASPQLSLNDAVFEPSTAVTTTAAAPGGINDPIIATTALVTSTDGPQTGWMNQLFEAPSPHLTGANAPATLVDMGPLHPVGTADRDQFDRAHQVVVQVTFKIHPGNEVVVTEPEESANSTSSKAPTARRSVGTTVNVIDSKVFNDGVVIEWRGCLVGLSLNQFKERCGEICERYAPGMQQMVLNSEVAPNLSWKASVGRTSPSFVLVDHLKFFDFVNSLTKSRTRWATLLIHNECSKAVGKKKAQHLSS
ncbi:uncharacterized protein MELLADRAFT_84862 [Melampsora larici-populina 98AG31]|uniref:Uncharacterized protein n=1 Tax=Melampsora larici-populina (strain 98AG31 / pathotype 3-4-7) TaxID=747676 RepID=F4SCR5_MELLP|nr:uncharacterized protein MELLADRAFT_84862 [Melampsora larici-populina 98AG31]EGF97562.1 hypothetical protein MELLADRAFT_84862 [Melampsora larici-populina 98AG31]